ncbi:MULTISPECIES: hypothetical protein [unclassified Pseudomonas]|uniref:hypothetical protein n=1 Tax=unclassified Pseudomonas TaxID=196821 RepID=UPI002E82313B|nr:hypothetical protein [Pseudomonas sp. 10C3]MEE3507749.1 hypothetical protein [Pseudomonas sp. 10C3]
MATSNIDRFDQLAGKVLAGLYESFPMTLSLTTEQFSSVIAIDSIETPEGEQQIFESEEFFCASITWLSKSGYITFGQQGSHPCKFYECTLTAKGLEVLKAVPDSLSGKSIGSQLQEAAKAGLMGTVKSLTGKAFGIGVTMGYSAVLAAVNS